jgi:hypothetical protein
MDQDSTPAPLASADARHVINRWSARGLFRVRGLGGKIAVEDVVPCSSYTLRLASQYEDRSVAERTVPFAGGPVDDHGRRPGPWDLQVERPGDFRERTEEVPIPHTERVRTCPRCEGRARTTCGQCQGFGKVACPWCNGTGYRVRTETRTVQDAGGNTTLQPVTTRERCTCFGGKVGCGGCGGEGTVVCGDCQGHGRVKTFEQLRVHFRVEHRTEVVHATRVPDRLLGQARGVVLVDEQAAPALASPKVGPRVDDRVE